MNEITFPTQSKITLIKASVVAVVFATVVFIAIILPSEYNVDPSGVGKLLGLTALANQVPAVEQQPLVNENLSTYHENEVKIVVPANTGVEYKFKMQQYANITYEWNSQGEQLFFDFHGEPNGDTTGYFESYTIATTHEAKGSMTVPFEGVHGWYWKNTGDQDVTVILKTQGNYEVVGLIH